MPRELHTAEEIRAEIARLLAVHVAELPLPERLVLEPDWTEAGGANWHIPAWPGIWPNTDAVRRAILDVKARWDMA